MSSSIVLSENDVESIAFELRKRLIDSVRRNKADGILLSGGLDSSCVASIDPKMKAVTVNLKSYGEDVNYVDIVKESLDLKHERREVDIDEALEAVPDVIRILRSFDPAIPNDIVVYFGLKLAKELGIKNVMTGDGSDELLGGYSFMRELDDLDSYIGGISPTLQFNSNDLCDFFNIGIKQPYIDREVFDFCVAIPKEFKIRHDANKVWGKWILRRAFEGMLPKEILWQSKRPLEFGSGMTRMREVISQQISDEEFKENPYDIRFSNKEHMYYYKVYKDIFGPVPPAKEGQQECPVCHGNMGKKTYHCRICGYCTETR